MAQQSARRDRDNQAATPYLEYATLIWTRSANSHAGRRSNGRARGRTDGSIRLRATAILTFSLALKGASGTVARLGVVAFWRWMASPRQSSSETAFAFRYRQEQLRFDLAKIKSRKLRRIYHFWWVQLKSLRSRMFRPPIVRRSQSGGR